MFEKIREMMRHEKQRWMLITGVVCVGIFVVLLFGGEKRKLNAEERMEKKESAAVAIVVTKEKQPEEGYLLGEEIDRKAFVARLEEQYHALEAKQEAFEQKMEESNIRIKELSAMDERLGARFKMLQYKTQTLENTRNAEGGRNAIPGKDLQQYQLDVVAVEEIKPQEEESVYLPAGSFVHGVLLTGVYAPADQNNPLPVLIRLSEAFYGPNETRVPLEGAFVIGKATGDLNSERALIQGSAISSVLSTGETFEARGNIGYVTDIRGQLGVKGEVVRNTGAIMAMSFLTGFLSGASQAFADSETTAVIGENGGVHRNTTGSASRQAAFQGMSESARSMSGYYQKQSEGIVPAIKVDAGTEVYLVVLEGVSIHGLKNNDRAHRDGFKYLD
jgi:hypothetical protein